MVETRELSSPNARTNRHAIVSNTLEMSREKLLPWGSVSLLSTNAHAARETAERTVRRAVTVGAWESLRRVAAVTAASRSSRRV
jgi:hypothetical protein